MRQDLRVCAGVPAPLPPTGRRADLHVAVQRVAATDRDPAQMGVAGMFRGDLQQRLKSLGGRLHADHSSGSKSLRHRTQIVVTAWRHVSICRRHSPTSQLDYKHHASLHLHITTGFRPKFGDASIEAPNRNAKCCGQRGKTGVPCRSRLREAFAGFVLCAVLQPRRAHAVHPQQRRCR
jgi:hypothetical protein